MEWRVGLTWFTRRRKGSWSKGTIGNEIQLRIIYRSREDEKRGKLEKILSMTK